MMNEIITSENVWREPSENERKGTFRCYTHCIVSYACLDELQPLFSMSKHYCYVYHDRDEAAPHYHAILTFEREKSFAWVRKQVVSNQNTFTKVIHSDVSSCIDYFQHINVPEKARYSFDEIVFDNQEYWTKRVDECDVEENSNDKFVDDLLSDDFSVERMSRKYGRDFIKNISRYVDARSIMLKERNMSFTVNAPDIVQSNHERACLLLAEWQNK